MGMDILMTTIDQTWSIYVIFSELGDKLEDRGHNVDVMRNRNPTERWRDYDRILNHPARDPGVYKTDLFQGELRHKTWIWIAGPQCIDRMDWDDFDHLIPQSQTSEEALPPNDAEETICPAGVHPDIYKPMDVAKRYDVLTVGNSNQERKDFSLVEEACEDLDFLHHDGWTGKYYSKQEMAHLYNKSRLYILLSEFEGGSMTALEAGACGIPVIHSPTGNPRNIDGIKTIPPHSSIEEIREAIEDTLQDPTTFRNEIVEKWSWDALLPRWEETLELV